MDSISPVGIASYIPPLAPITTSTVASPLVSPPTDSVAISGASAGGLDQTGLYPAPDPAFAAFLKSDPALAKDFAAGSVNPFGFDNGVLSQDDTLASSPSASTAGSSGAAATPPTASSLAARGLAAMAAESINLATMASTVPVSSPLTNALFGITSPTPADPSAVFFSGGSMANLLNAQGSAAMAYLTPQAQAAAAASGSAVNASA